MSCSDPSKALIDFGNTLKFLAEHQPTDLSQQLLYSIDRLRLSIESPEVTTARIVRQHLEAACLREIMENGMLAKLCSVNRPHWAAYQLAEVTGRREDRTDAIMRILSAAGILDSVRKSTYVANDVTVLLDHHEQRQAIRKPRSKYWPRAKVERKESSEDHTETGIVKGIPWFRIWPADAELQKTDGGLKYNRPLIVDIEAESDENLHAFRQAFPDFRETCILKNTLKLPEAIGTNLSEEQQAVLDTPLQILAYDESALQFVQGARIYLLNDVLHNWERDGHIVKVLQTIVDIMDANYSRILIVEKVVVVLGVDGGFKVTRTPRGTAGLEVLERTEQQWIDLLERVQLEIVQIWGKEGIIGNVIEAMVKPHEWF